MKAYPLNKQAEAADARALEAIMALRPLKPPARLVLTDDARPVSAAAMDAAKAAQRAPRVALREARDA